MSSIGSGLASSSGTELIAGASYTNGDGINVSQTVTAILTADAAPETAWQKDQATLTNQETELGNLQSEMSSLQSSFQSLSSPTGVFSSLDAYSSDTSTVNATATSAAAAGTHTIVVTGLASTGESYSGDLDSASSTFAAGNLIFTLGAGNPQTIAIPTDTTTGSTTTLTDAAAYINQQNLGITASVVTDSSGARLALTSTASGVAASVAVQSAPGGLTFTNVAGTDAGLTVDGVPIDSSTNQVSTAIPGVTLSLSGITSASGVAVQIGADTTDIAAALNSFVSAFNAVVTDLNGQFQYNGGVAAGGSSSSSNSTSGVLEDDPTARLIQQQLLSSISETSGSTTSTVNSLADLGITMNDDGTLTLNSTTLQSALTNNYSDVTNFLQSTDASTFGGNFTDMMSNLTDPTESPLVLDLSGVKSNYTQDQDNINTLQAQLATLQSTLTNQYSAMNVTLQMYPTTMDEIDTELGVNTNNSSNSSSSS
jgi:flagellar hook-associated protein 2